MLSHRVQKLLALIVICHCLAVADEALGPLAHAALFGGWLGDGGGSCAAGHGVSGAAQQQNRTGLPNLVEQVTGRRKSVRRGRLIYCSVCKRSSPNEKRFIFIVPSSGRFKKHGI